MDEYFQLRPSRSGTRSVWLKNNTFYAGNPQDYPVVFGMWTAYISLSVVFLAVVNPYVLDYSQYLGILSFLMGFPGIFYAIKCFLTEPGILPRGNIIEQPIDEELAEEEKIITMQEEEEQQQQQQKQQEQLSPMDQAKQQEIGNTTKQISDDQSSQQSVATTASSPSNETYVQGLNPYENPISNPYQITTKTSCKKQTKCGLLEARYCSTCCIMRPPMSSHCSSCNNCVKRFDHHCVFMGNCIGERNQSFFVLFLISTLTWVFYVFSCTITLGIHLSQQNQEPFYVLTAQPLIIATLLITTSLAFITCILRCNSNLKNYNLLFFVMAVSGATVFSAIKSESSRITENPVVILYLSAVYLFVVLFVLPQACFNAMIAAKGSTLKLENYSIGLPNRSQASWQNFKNVMCMKIPQSLVGLKS